jgi:hypothetical protein
MGLFFDVLSAINNPNQQANVSQLESLTNSIQNLGASNGIQPAQMQNMVSGLGNLIRPALQQQRAAVGGGQLENLVGQALGAGAGATALQALIPPQLMQQFSQVLSQKTGLSPNLVQSVLPSLLPSVLGLLQMGSGKPGTTNSNALLNSFLDSDQDGDVDLGDVMKFAGRFLYPATK